MNIIDKIETEQLKDQKVTFNVGDTVKIHTRVKEGEKERTQIFTGLVISRKGKGLNSQFTVRRISHGEGVERIFPLHSPAIEKISVESQGRVRRSKLYYLRGKKGTLAVKPALVVAKGAKGAKAAK